MSTPSRSAHSAVRRGRPGVRPDVTMRPTDRRKDMTIKAGDTIPKAQFTVMTAEGPAVRTTDQIFKGRRVVLLGVPGAFTPTCTKTHLPGFVARAEAFKATNIDEIAVTAVNDVFVMSAWAKDTGAADKVSFLADGSGDFARALGLTLDLSERGLGVRSQRYSMLVENGVVKRLNVEASPGEADTSSADALLAQIS
jgi:peroxiredoxin